jgi:hypothetical protein
MNLRFFLLVLTIMSGAAAQAPKAPAVSVPYIVSFDDVDWTEVDGVLQTTASHMAGEFSQGRARTQ